MTFDRTIARLIDHTILRPDATRADVQQVCREALQYEFASVCVNSFWVPLVAAALSGSPVKTCAVSGFPLGAGSTASKVAETVDALQNGASEIDMVINVGALVGGENDVVRKDIGEVVAVSHSRGAIVKVILETALLNAEQKTLACELAVQAGVDFVKTSTGFSKSGATVEDVALLRRIVGPGIGVKASGGIRTLETLREMVAAGANRVGASASVAIVGAAAT